MTKILFTTPIINYPAINGPELRIQNTIKALSKISDLYIVSRKQKKNLGGDKAELFFSKYCLNFLYSPLANRYSNNYFLYKLQKLNRNYINKEEDFIVKIAKQNNIDIIWFGYGNISFPLIKKIKSLNPHIKLVCDTDSVWSRFILREIPYETDQQRVLEIKKKGEEKRAEEKEWVKLCDVTTAVSEIDAKYYKKLTTDSQKIKIFRNVIDLGSYEHHFSKSHKLSKPYLYIAGSYWSNSPMDKGTRWFIKNVFPKVIKKIPRIKLCIVGNGSDSTLKDIKNNNIFIKGQIKSVLPYLCNANISLAPLFFESGTRFKILESGACKIPVVSTSLGAEGLNITDKKDILLADEPESFANAIIALVESTSYAKRIGDNLYELVKAEYSINKLIEQGRNIINYINNPYEKN